MRRRVFLLGAGASLGAFAAMASAQAADLPTIGVIGGSRDRDAELLGAFRDGLKERGFVDGQNVVITYRWAEDHYERLRDIASELVRSPVNLLVSFAGTEGAIAAKSATTAIPVVFLMGTDPVERGVVAALGHPGGNVTGVNTLTGDFGLAAKRLELLHALVPQLASFAALVNPKNPVTQSISADMGRAAAALGISLSIFEVQSDTDLEQAFEQMHAKGCNAAVINGGDPYLLSRRELVTRLAGGHQIPVLYGLREYVAAGGLISYGTDQAEGRRLVGLYAGRILGGERPGDLPVQQSTKVSLTINLRTARTLGLRVPDSLLLQADEVIE